MWPTTSPASPATKVIAGRIVVQVLRRGSSPALDSDCEQLSELLLEPPCSAPSFGAQVDLGTRFDLYLAQVA